MKIFTKIQQILKDGKYTQEELAHELNVSFTTLNSWVNNRSTPYKRNQVIINLLYLKITGQQIVPESELQYKRKELFKKSGKYKNLLKYIVSRKDLVDQLGLSLTYNSNRLEGSTLSKGETRDILFNNMVIKDKTLVEHMEAKNHHTAWEYLLKYLSQRGKINEQLSLKLHQILMNGIWESAGTYRTHNVRMVGSYVPTTNHLSISKKLKTFYKSFEKTKSLTLTKTVSLHGDFEQIHPFADGNGRVGRLLLNGILLSIDFPPAIILQEKKNMYLKYLQKYQMQKEITQLENFIMDAILEGFKLIET